ncbi:mechanosensitive ion channel family protein [Altererythrobacter sp. MF3-039]|uniref:mechanosensitive ion channel family protein n=1 Tax=Altererythrobacter sp. MF3-039 TaxID=3252901 RepID=UPI00390C78A3
MSAEATGPETPTTEGAEGEAIEAAPSPEPVATEARPEDPVSAAADLKDAVTEKGGTMGDMVETLDAMAFDLGDMHISAWDAIVVLGTVALVIFFAWMFTGVLKSFIGRLTKLDDTQKLLSEKLITIVIWGLAFFVGIDLLGIDLTALAVFSGAFGLAIGFGLQKTFGNLIAGIILLMDKSIKPGDVIAVADTAGAETFGQIRKIGIRAVSIVTRDQKEYLIPNENLMINQVENWSYSSRNVRIQIPVGVSYTCDIKKAEELMMEAAKAVPRVLKSPPPTAWLSGYGDSSVDFVIHCWIRDPEDGVGNVRSAVLKELWWLFQDNGVEIPFPQRDLNLRNNAQVEQLIAAISQRLDDRK